MRSVISVIIVAVFFYSGLAFGYEPGEAVEFTELKPFNTKTNSKWGPALKDIVNHEAPGDSNPYDDLVTLAHETCHGIHAYIRNKLGPTGQKVNGFYVLDNNAVIVREPKMRKSQVAPFVPQSLRWLRYSTYITGQTAWDDRPLYIFDEWNAYANGGIAGVDLVQKGLWKAGWRDALAGQLEFVVYGIATAMAIEKHDPDYFHNYHQFTEFLGFEIKRSMESYLIGSQMEPFKWDKQDEYYAKLKSSTDAEKLRQFVRDLFGPAWTQEVLGF